MITPAAAVTSFYAILATATGAASIAVRAALGNGASSVIVRDDLAVGALPVAPFVVLSQGSISGSPDWDAQRMVLTWWIYDDVTSYKNTRIDALIALIDAAYPPDDPTVIPSVEVRRLSASQVNPDRALGNRPHCALPFQLSWR